LPLRQDPLLVGFEERAGAHSNKNSLRWGAKPPLTLCFAVAVARVEKADLNEHTAVLSCVSLQSRTSAVIGALDLLLRTSLFLRVLENL